MTTVPDHSDASSEEVWRPVHYPGFALFYEVSNLGRVRSCHRGKWHIMTPRFNKDGYPMVSMYANGMRKGDSVHRLVCWAFNGPPNILHTEAAHLDGSRTNALASNLRWVSRVENISHKRRHGTMLLGEKHALAKLTEAQVSDIIEALAVGVTAKRLAKVYGVTSSAIEDIRTGKNWRHIPRPAKLIAHLSTGNGQNGANNHNARLTWEQASEIRRRVTAGEHILTLGREFSMSKAAVYKLVAGETYRSAPADALMSELRTGATRQPVSQRRWGRSS